MHIIFYLYVIQYYRDDRLFKFMLIYYKIMFVDPLHFVTHYEFYYHYVLKQFNEIWVTVAPFYICEH